MECANVQLQERFDGYIKLADHKREFHLEGKLSKLERAILKSLKSGSFPVGASRVATVRFTTPSPLEFELRIDADESLAKIARSIAVGIDFASHDQMFAGLSAVAQWSANVENAAYTMLSRVIYVMRRTYPPQTADFEIDAQFEIAKETHGDS